MVDEVETMTAEERRLRGERLESVVVANARRELWRGLESRQRDPPEDDMEQMAYVAGVVLGKLTTFAERWR